MSQPQYELLGRQERHAVRIRARGNAVLTNPMLNRGTAFTEEQRRLLGLTGLLPRAVSKMEAQLRRVYGQYQRRQSDLAKNVFLANLRDRNEVLFYRLLIAHIEEMLPIVYTPRSGSRSSGSATSTAARAGSTCRSTTPRTSGSRCATGAGARRTSTSSSPPTPRASSASATRASAA